MQPGCHTVSLTIGRSSGSPQRHSTISVTYYSSPPTGLDGPDGSSTSKLLLAPFVPLPVVVMTSPVRERRPPSPRCSASSLGVKPYLELVTEDLERIQQEKGEKQKRETHGWLENSIASIKKRTLLTFGIRSPVKPICLATRRASYCSNSKRGSTLRETIFWGALAAICSISVPPSELARTTNLPFESSIVMPK